MSAQMSLYVVLPLGAYWTTTLATPECASVAMAVVVTVPFRGEPGSCIVVAGAVLSTIVLTATDV